MRILFNLTDGRKFLHKSAEDQVFFSLVEFLIGPIAHNYFAANDSSRVVVMRALQQLMFAFQGLIWMTMEHENGVFCVLGMVVS